MVPGKVMRGQRWSLSGRHSLPLLPPFPDVLGGLCDKVLGPGPHEDDSDKYADETEDSSQSFPVERQVKNGGDKGVYGLKHGSPQRHWPPLF